MRYFYRMEINEFKEYIIPLRDKLTGIAISILHNADDANDAVQETYLRLWKNREELVKHPNVGGYATMTIKNVCIDRLRRQKDTVPVDNVAHSTDNGTPYSITEQRDSVRLVRLIIDSLPGLQKSVLMMRDVEGYELSEIADITGSTVATVTVTLSRARKKVREQFLRLSTHN